MDSFEKIYTRAITFLSYRPRSEKEVRDKLIGKTSRKRKEYVDEEVVEQVIEKLKRQKFINDTDFAKMWIEQRIRFKPRSVRVIKRELKQKGISNELIEAQISNFQFPISNELEMAKQLVQKRIKRYRNLSRQEIYQKLGRFLASKGFDWDTIKTAIDSLITEEV